jgi:minor extracellular serine protease Vpr
MPRLRSATAALAGAVVGGLLLAGAGAPASGPPIASVDEAGWQGVLGVRPVVSTAQRYIVVLRTASLASRVRAAGGRATEAQMRAWTAAADGAQEQFLRRVAASGAQVAPEHRYVRVLNAFSSRLDPTSLSLLDRDREVAGIYPVRVAYPAVDEITPGLPGPIPSASQGLDLPGLDGSGVVVALLDTGIDRSHPYLRSSVLPGIDVITPGSGGIAQPHPTIPGRPERHGTELAGIVSGSDGPAGLHGVAPASSILPVRVAGWQPDAEGGYAVYSRTDQLLAGLEAAVDPNDDGDAHDAARVALVGMAEPYAAFPDGPLARAIAGATELDMLVIVPAGNDGHAGPAFGSVAGPGGAPAALTVAATDGRLSSPTVRVHVRAGLRVLFEGVLPLGGSPTHTVTAGVVPVTRAATSRGLKSYFDENGVSTTAGAAVLLPRSGLSDESVEEAARSGALSVLVEGPLPAGAFSLDVPSGVPVVGLPTGLAKTVRALHASGIPVTVSVGVVQVAENVDSGGVAPFSSQGLAFGGVLKPELVAPGVSVPTSEPGRNDEGDVRYGTMSGTSASAAVTAGAAAVLAGARPRARATDLLGLLVGSARGAPDPSGSWIGRVDLQAAVQQEVVVEPAVISFGPVVKGSVALEQTVRVRNLTTRRVFIPFESSSDEGVEVGSVSRALRLRPGATGEVVLRAEVGTLPEAARVATGELVLHVAGSTNVRLPWAIAFPTARVDLLSQVSIDTTGERVSDATPAVVSFVVGAIESEKDLQVRPVDVLEIQLWRGSTFLGILSKRRELLPGRYAFGLTGRGPRGEPLSRGRYVVQLVARPDDGTRRQVESVEYVVS